MSKKYTPSIESFIGLLKCEGCSPYCHKEDIDKRECRGCSINSILMNGGYSISEEDIRIKVRSLLIETYGEDKLFEVLL